MMDAAARDDFEALVAADEAFHHSVIQLADHDLLLASWKSLYMRIHQIMALRNRDERNLAEVAGNHPPIVEALEAGDTERAVRLISEHTRTLAAFDPATIAHDQ
jgi:DNA-binding GntR family transcriptional regulator